MLSFNHEQCQAYATRNLTAIDSLLQQVDDHVIVIGTSLGELREGKDALRQLLHDDFRYWIPLEILEPLPPQKIGEYDYYSIPAIAHYRFRENEKTYERYLQAVQSIQHEASSESYKAIKIQWMLDHLLASRKKKIRQDPKSLTIEILARQNNVQLIAFSFPMEAPHVHGIVHNEPEMDQEYHQDVQLLQGDPSLTSWFLQEANNHQFLFSEAHLVKHANLFVGCGIVKHSSSFEEDLRANYTVLDQGRSSHDALYTLRKRIGEVMLAYANGTPSFYVRFFGITDEQQHLLMLRSSFPFYWILEQ
jgi:hypothetical protein